MKKFAKKLLVAFIAVAAMVCMGVMLAACGGGAAKSTGYYSANKQISYQNFQPASNFFYITVTEQSIETYDDGTYCLTVNGSCFSNIKTGADVPTEAFTANEKGHAVVKYYGTFTENEKTEDDVTLVLAKPTRVTYARQGKMMVDTANWTDAMSAQETAEGKDPVTADAYLASKVSEEVFVEGGLEVYVMYTAYSFKAIPALNSTVGLLMM